MLRTFSIIFHRTCSLECWLLFPPDFPHEQQRASGRRSRRQPLRRLEALCLWGGFQFQQNSVFVVFQFKPPFSRVMAIPGARYRRWIPAQMMPTLSLNIFTTLDQGISRSTRLFIEIVITCMAYRFIFLMPALLPNSHCAGSRNSPTCTAGSQIRTSLRLAAPLS